MKFANPIPSGKLTSAGTGKTTVAKMFRCRTLADTLNDMENYGGEHFAPNLLELNLAASNCPLICLSNPHYSGLLAIKYNATRTDYEDLVPAEAAADFETLIQQFKGKGDSTIKSLSDFTLELNKAKMLNLTPIACLRQILFSGEYHSLDQDGIKRNSLELIEEVLQVPNSKYWYVCCLEKDEYQPTFVFAAVPYDLPTQLPGALPQVKAANWVQLRFVSRWADSTFHGTGVVRQPVIEGFTQPVIGGSVVPPAAFKNIDLFPNLVGQSSFLSIESINKIDKWLDAYTTGDTCQTFPVPSVPGFSYALLTANSKIMEAAENSTLKGMEFEETKVGKEVKYSKTEALSLFLRIKRSHLIKSHALGSQFKYTTVSTSEYTSVQNGELKNRRLDIFADWMTRQKGDVWIETLGQIWNMITDTESTLKNGQSSGIPRAMDAGTGNATWAFYVARGSTESDAVSLGSYAGLEGGVTAWAFNGKHIEPEIYSSHRRTGRAIAHVVLYSYTFEDHKFVVFIDTPQITHARKGYIFLVNESESKLIEPNKFIGSFKVDSDLVQPTGAIPQALVGCEVQPEGSERIVDEALLDVTAQLIDKNGIESLTF